MAAKRNFKLKEYFSVYFACVYSNMIGFPFLCKFVFGIQRIKKRIMKQKHGKKFRAK